MKEEFINKMNKVFKEYDSAKSPKEKRKCIQKIWGLVINFLQEGIGPNATIEEVEAVNKIERVDKIVSMHDVAVMGVALINETKKEIRDRVGV